VDRPDPDAEATRAMLTRGAPRYSRTRNYIFVATSRRTRAAGSLELSDPFDTRRKSENADSFGGTGDDD